MTSDYTPILNKAVSELSESQSYDGLFHQYRDGEPLPSARSLRRIVELSREILFPGYFGNSTIHRRTLNYHIGVNVEERFIQRDSRGTVLQGKCQKHCRTIHQPHA